MKTVYTITGLIFEDDYLILEIDNRIIKLKLADISEKLEKATAKERKDYTISPSGYGIHWRSLDEDLSVNGLVNVTKKQMI